MSLGNKKTVKEIIIFNIENKALFRIQILEEILSDGSKVYNVVTLFYNGKDCETVLTLEDASACDFNEAGKQFEAKRVALSLFGGSQVL